MKTSVPAIIVNNGTGMHDGKVEVSLSQYAETSTPELLICAGMGVAAVTTKKDALRLAAMILQIAQRLR